MIRCKSLRKQLSNELMNEINYITTRGTSKWTYIGFIESENEYYNIGITIEDKSFIPCYIIYQLEPFGNDSKETEKIANEKPWILLFHGIDNGSYFKRFMSEDILKKWFCKTEKLTKMIFEGSYFYNS